MIETTTSSLLTTTDAGTIVKKSKSNFSSAFYFLPQPKRLAIKRVYAFFRLIDDVVDEEPNSLIAQNQLGKWKLALEKAYQTGTSEVPLLKALMESIHEFQIPVSYFMELIEGCGMDITKNRYANRDELKRYCYLVASTVGLVCMRIFGHQTPSSDECAKNLGIALQLTNIIRDVGVDAQKGRIYIPLEWLQMFHLTEKDILERKLVDDSKKNSFQMLMKYMETEALLHYHMATVEFANYRREKNLGAALLMALVYRQLLRKIHSRQFPVLNERVRLTFWEKLGLLIPFSIRYFLGMRLPLLS